MGDSTEMQTFRTNGSHVDADLSEVRVEAAGPNGSVAAAERRGLLSEQTSYTNGASPASNSNQTTGNQNGSTQEKSALCKVKDQLNEVICFKVIRLWMIIVALILLIVLIVLLSLLVCASIYQDPDENFDPTLFKVPLHLDGSFRLPNMVFTEELLTLSSNQSQELTGQLEDKLTDLYSSSPALGRYFSTAEILAFSNGSVIADYTLTFVMPEDEQDLLRNFTLSRDMVFNVFRQFLHEQELQETDPLYIERGSLRMLSSRSSAGRETEEVVFILPSH